MLVESICPVITIQLWSNSILIKVLFLAKNIKEVWWISQDTIDVNRWETEMLSHQTLKMRQFSTGVAKAGVGWGAVFPAFNIDFFYFVPLGLISS